MSILLSIIHLIKSFILMLIIWFYIGIVIGAIVPMQVVYIFRIYTLKGAIMLTRMLLIIGFSACILRSYIIKIIFKQYYILLLFIPALLYSICLMCILPTPKEYQTIEKITNDVFDDAEIVIEDKVKFLCLYIIITNNTYTCTLRKIF